VLDAFHTARGNGVDVKIIYDAEDNPKGPKKKNETAIKTELIKPLCVPRATNSSYIAHNKFIILLKGDEPIAVWTGSTNITLNGIFGHLNVGHSVRDPGIAALYLDYWNELSEDPEARDLKPITTKSTPAPTKVPAGDGTVAVFSPRADHDALDWYVDMMAKASAAVFFTGAFGVPVPFVDLLKTSSKVVRYFSLRSRGRAKMRAISSTRFAQSAPTRSSSDHRSGSP
jgi:hypothetical protein